MSSPKRPNFLIIVADDLGFSDMGAYGSEIQTPWLDRLAARGVRLTGFHTASACSPTRSMLFSGTDHHLAGLGQMAETIGRVPAYQGQPGYEGVLNDSVAALPEILRDAGYATYMAGKWHLGLTPDSTPHARGFHRSWALLPGAGKHYEWQPPQEEGGSIAFMPPLYYEDDRKLAREDLPQPFYSTEVFASKLLGYLREHRQDARTKDQPLFAYLPFTAPHWPIQADAPVVAKYKGAYDAGPEALRAARLRALVQRGLIPAAAEAAAHPLAYTYGTQPWAETPEDERRHAARVMETYAAMVDEMDRHVGRVVQWLEAEGVLEDTFILFCSDNGGEGALMEGLPLRPETGLQALIARRYDQSYENIGRPNSFNSIGPLWAQAGTAPSRMYKAWITEGGIRCPCIVHYPALTGGASAPAERAPGSVSHAFTTVMDVLPTVLDLAGVAHPGRTFRGRPVHLPRGASWVPHLRGQAARVHSGQHVTGWELFGQQAIRKGAHKAVFLPAPAGSNRWELYDIERDPGETHDLSAERPELLAELIEFWAKYVAETGVILIDNATRNKLQSYGPK